MAADSETILRAMSIILVEAGSLVYHLESDRCLAEDDRLAILRAASRIVSDAGEVMSWLMEAPFETTRH